MLRARLATAALAIPLIIWVVVKSPGWLFAAVVCTFSFLSVVEYAMMAFPDPVKGRVGRILGITGGGALILCFGWARPELLPFVLVAFVTLSLVTMMLLEENPATAAAGAGQLTLGLLYAAFLLPHLIWLRELAGGWRWVFYSLAIAMAGDSGAYFGGRYLGRHRLLPRVSPAKTVEGALAGIFCSLVAAAAARPLFFRAHEWREIIMLGAAAGLAAQLGDLCESMLKRAFGAKDSGWLLPGHGGVLDRTDSLVFSVVLVYYYLSLSS